MRVMLVYPPISKLERYSSELGHSGGNQIPLGVYYLAGYLRHKGHTVAVIDGETDNLTSEIIAEKIGSFRPALVGISSTTVAFHRSLELARGLKVKFPETPIVLGGAHISSNVKHAMSFPEFDYGVLREGEETCQELIEVLEGTRGPESVLGLVFRRNDELVINPPRPYIGNLDELPLPAYYLIKDITVYNPPPSNYKRIPVANIITSRGCPNKCTFCDKNIFGDTFRPRSTDSIVAEIKHLVRNFGVREIAFVDDTFTVDKKRVYELFSKVEDNGLSFPWTCMAHINSVDYELLKFMRQNGCWHISFGIESASPEILKLIRKKISLEQTNRVISWCSELGIKTKGFFMVGHPGETLETMQLTMRYALQLPLDDVVVTVNTPIPGSPQYKEVKKFGRLDESDWSLFSYWRPVFVPFGLSEQQLLDAHRQFYRRFYLRPHIIWRYCLELLSPAGLKRAISLFKSLPFLFHNKVALNKGKESYL